MPQCWNCDREVSWQAKVCPGCGHPEPWREPGHWYADVDGDPPTAAEQKKWAEENKREQRILALCALVGAVGGGAAGVEGGGVFGLVVGAILGAITLRFLVGVIWAVISAVLG